MSAAARRAARASWTVAVTRPGAVAVQEEEDDDLYWLRVDRDERARLTWELSRELFVLAARNGGVFDEESGTFVSVDTEKEDDFERRLPRSHYVLTRR